MVATMKRPKAPAAVPETGAQAAEDDLDALLDAYSAQAEQESRAVQDSLAAASAPRKAPARMAAARDAGLSTSLGPSNVGFRLLAKQGYAAGEGIGRSRICAAEPIALDLKTSRAGLGIDEARRRQREADLAKAKQEREAAAVVESANRAGYVAASSQAFSRRTLQRHFNAALSACETLDAQAGVTKNGVLASAQAAQAAQREAALGVGTANSAGSTSGSFLPRKRARREGTPLLQGQEDDDEAIATWNRRKAEAAASDGLAQAGSIAGGLTAPGGGSSAVTDANEAVSFDPTDHLPALLEYLRSRHCYCLFCACAYDTADDMRQHCPGPDEQDH